MKEREDGSSDLRDVSITQKPESVQHAAETFATAVVENVKRAVENAPHRFSGIAAIAQKDHDDWIMISCDNATRASLMKMLYKLAEMAAGQMGVSTYAVLLMLREMHLMKMLGDAGKGGE